ncbi:MAG TPA: hypothetical protein PKA27_11605 [Fimbriimonadaceae bacterium]|nr:hypothetical protein [Fimbriimonadaceae bacterium]
MIELKVVGVGNSIGITLPKEATARLGVTKGDRIFLVETEGGFVMTAYDPEISEQLEAASSVMKRYRETLRELAK